MIFPLVFFALLLTVAIIAAVFHWQGLVRRRDALKALAAARGWSFVEKHASFHQQFGRIAPFAAGGSRKLCRHILTGRDAVGPLAAFQYQYTVQSGKSSHTYHFRCAAIEMPLAAPGLSIQREHVGHKLADALGGEDIDFESDAFSRRYWVQCPDRRLAYDVLHPQMQEWLMQVGDAHWQWTGTRLFLHERGHLEPRDVDRLLAALGGFRQRLPRHRVAEAST